MNTNSQMSFLLLFLILNFIAPLISVNKNDHNFRRNTPEQKLRAKLGMSFKYENFTERIRRSDNFSGHRSKLLLKPKSTTTTNLPSSENGYENEAKTAGSGKIEAGDRIINGVDAEWSDHPWMVFIETSNSEGIEVCGGTVISRSTVLTAKHCIEKSCNGKISYGSVNKKDPKYEVLFDCGSSDVIKHSSSDLAIIRTKRTLDGSTALAIPVNESESPQPLQDVYPVGWGRACEDPGSNCNYQTRKPNTMQTVRVKVAPDDVCASKSYGPTMFCAGGMTGGMPKDACSGDSGGPVECMDRLGKMYQCGVTSIGPAPPDCGRSPGGYVNLADPELNQWLRRQGGATSDSRIRTNITENAQRALSSDGTTLIGRWHKKQFDLFVLIFIGSIILREIMIVVY